MNGSESPFSDETLFHSVIEASPAGMLIVDEEGRVVLANRAVCEQFGFTADELHNQPVEVLVPESDRPDHTAHRARYMDHPRARPMAAGQNLYGKRKDGSTFPVDISLHPITIQQRHMVLANILDATDRRRAEQEREQRQAMERMAVMGQLAGGVANEIRTPLSVIRNDAYFLRLMADKLGEEGMECLEEINAAVTKAERIVSELLDFTLDPRSEPRVVDLGRLIDDAVRLAGIPSTVTLVRNLQDESSKVYLDPDQIERVLINLIRNAVQAVGEAGQVEINASMHDGFLVVEVIDNGPGISEDNLERVFEPLFTTKTRGIGLGLAVSKQYVKRNGGTLTARNLDGRGACLKMTMPAVLAAS